MKPLDRNALSFLSKIFIIACLTNTFTRVKPSDKLDEEDLDIIGLGEECHIPV